MTINIMKINCTCPPSFSNSCIKTLRLGKFGLSAGLTILAIGTVTQIARILRNILLAVPVEIRVPQIMEKIAVPPAMPHHFCIIISTLRLLLYRDIHDIMSPYGYSFERLTMRRQRSAQQLFAFVLGRLHHKLRMENRYCVGVANEPSNFETANGRRLICLVCLL